MSNFDSSHWSDSRFAEEYRDQADGYVPERRKLIEIVQSLYPVQERLYHRPPSFIYFLSIPPKSS